MMTDNEFQTVFEEGYQEGWGSGFGYGVLIGIGTAGVIGLALMMFAR